MLLDFKYDYNHYNVVRIVNDVQLLCLKSAVSKMCSSNLQQSQNGQMDLISTQNILNIMQHTCAQSILQVKMCKKQQRIQMVRPPNNSTMTISMTNKLIADTIHVRNIMAGPNGAPTARNIQKSILETKVKDVLTTTSSFLPLFDITRLRRVNKFFCDEFDFKFKCKNYCIYFEYKNVLDVNIIKKLLCENFFFLQYLPMYFLQLQVIIMEIFNHLRSPKTRRKWKKTIY